MHRAWGYLLALALGLGTLGASDIAGRYNALNHQMMCTCGCAQILGECNHVGCPNSGGMLKTLHTDLAAGMGDRAILMAFQQEYGPESLASPMFTRLNRAAWAVPWLTLLLGLLLALLWIRRWRGHRGPVSAAAPLDPRALARVRRETEEL